MKNPLTPAGIEPATFRIVAQHLNHCATAVPHSKHVALLKNKKDCADEYCVTLIELQAHRDDFIQNTMQVLLLFSDVNEI